MTTETPELVDSPPAPDHTPAVVATPMMLDRTRLDLLKRTIAAGLDDDEFELFSQVCNRTGLDPFMRQIHAVKRWNNSQGREVMNIQVGIDGFRVLAARTGAHAGTEDAVFSGKTRAGSGKGEVDVPAEATVTVWRIVGGIRVAFVASAHWSEYYPGNGGEGFMWRKMPHTMLGKTAEALALRKGFPAELSGVYSEEEMAQASARTGPVETIPPHERPVPEGFTTWDEYEGAYAEYTEAWKVAPRGKKMAVQTLIKSNGWNPPVSRDVLDALWQAIGGKDTSGSGPDTDKPETSETSEAAPPAAVVEDGAGDEPAPEATAEPVEPAGDAGQGADRVADAPEASAGSTSTPGAQEQQADAGPSPADDPAPAPPGDGQVVDGAQGGSESTADASGVGDHEEPAVPSPAPEPPSDEPSSGGERTRLAMALKTVWGADGKDAEARAVLVSIVTGGRSTSARQLTAIECGFAIRAAKLFESGHLAFGRTVERDGRKVGEAILPPAGVGTTPGIPADSDVPTILPAAPASALLDDNGEELEGEERKEALARAMERGKRLGADIKAHWKATGRLK